MIYSREYESMHREDLLELQLERLQIALNHVYRNVSFYKNQFDSSGIDPTSIRSIDDFQKLPFTTRADLTKSYPYEAFAVPLRDIVRIHSTSGTKGVPVVVGYTRNDIAIWSSLVARVLTAAGVGGNDLVQIAFDYSQSTGGLGFHYGAEKLGASVIPASGEEILRQIKIMKDYRSSILVSTPGYALHLLSELERRGINSQELNLSTAILGSEPWSEKLRSEIEARLKIKTFDNYGLSEIIGPGVAFECEEHCGMHVNEDHFIAEIINPETLEVLQDGEKGELVFTTLTKQAFPLIRYRTGDISTITRETCVCGRTTARIERIGGRIDDMIIVEGNNLFPSQIEAILIDIEGVEPHFQIVLDREEGRDSIELKIEVSPDFPSLDEVKHIESFKERVREDLRVSAGMHARITLTEPGSLGRSSGGKIRRVIDKREL